MPGPGVGDHRLDVRLDGLPPEHAADLLRGGDELRRIARAAVLLDRFVDSSLAYQGAGRGLGIEEVRALNAFATGGLRPDRTLLLRLSPSDRTARLQHRDETPDRLEREADAFFETIAAAYDELAAADPERWRVLDASASPDAVLAQALEALDDLA